MNKQTILITGGAGFIGSALIRLLLGPMGSEDRSIINLDKLTYAGNLESLANEAGNPSYRFEQVDICDAPGVARVFQQYEPTAVMHLAAESHVDRSIDGPAQFIETNVAGTCVLLEAARAYWSGLPAEQKQAFRFHHISTDEVYGTLGRRACSPKKHPIAQIRPIRRARRRRITWFAPGMKPMGCRC